MIRGPGGTLDAGSLFTCMYPEIEIGPITLQTFGLCFGLGFIAAGAVIARRLVELGRPGDWAYEMAFSALVGGLVGAKLYWAIDNLEENAGFFDNLLSGSGLTWYGGAIGGAIAVVAWAWYRGILNLGLLDLSAVPLAVGYAIGRVGCQLSGDGDYGEPWDGPWAMAYPDGTVPTETPVHPTPVYETLAMGTVGVLLWTLRDRFRPGLLFALYLVLAGLERFLIEFIRRNEDVATGLTQAQLLSVVIVVGGAVWFAVGLSRGGSGTSGGGRPTPA